jgi:alcohol dehydrogenase
MKFGHEAMTPNRALIGGMAEYCWLPEDTAIFRVPSNLTDSVASPANCATATVAAVFRNAGSVKNQIVVIHGAGMLGQTACAMASHTGASKVIALDHNSHRCTQSLKFGAHLTLPPDQATARVHDLTSGRGADICLEFAGQPESFELGINLLRVGGKLVLAGATFPAKPVPIQAEQIVRRMLQITGVYNYSPEDLEAALAFLSATVIRFPFDELVGATYRLKEVNAAMDFAETKRPPRVALIP